MYIICITLITSSPLALNVETVWGTCIQRMAKQFALTLYRVEFHLGHSFKSKKINILLKRPSIKCIVVSNTYIIVLNSPRNV